MTGVGTTGLARVAGAQQGLAHHRQLAQLTISRGAIRHRLASGSLHHVLPSVLAVGHPTLQPLAPEMAALLYVWHDGVISHHSAASLWGFSAPPPGVSVTAIGRKVRHQPGVRIHQVPYLDSRDVRIRHGLPVTAPARTLIDRAGQTTPDHLDRELNEARVLKLVTDAELRAAIDRCPGRKGVGNLHAVLAAQRGPSLTRSEAERRLKAIIEQGQLPWPTFNVYVHGKQVDLLWPDLQLVVEVDGYGPHGHRTAFERDRQRDQQLAAHGYSVIRITWRQLPRTHGRPRQPRPSHHPRPNPPRPIIHAAPPSTAAVFPPTDPHAE